MFRTENEPAHEAVPDFDEGRRSRHQPGVGQPRHHLRRVVESGPRRPVNFQGLQVGHFAVEPLRVFILGEGEAPHCFVCLFFLSFCLRPTAKDQGIT